MNRTVIIGVVVVIAIALIGYASTATNMFGATGAGRHDAPIGIDDIKPPECQNITVTNRILGSGTLRGTAANDLMLGEDQADTITGADGDDCLSAGEGDDSLNGGKGNDVCIGGPGNDSFHNSCETQIQ